MSSAVQFYGMDQVLDAMHNKKLPAWGMWQGRQFLFKYEGDSLEESESFLDQILQGLSQNGTQATYTLKFFEQDNGKAVKIKENTVCDGGSFNFKLVGPEHVENFKQNFYNNSPRVLEVLNGLDKRLAAIEAAQIGGIDDEEETPLETIGNILKNPDLLSQYINIGRSLLGLQPVPGYIGNVKLPMGQNQAIGQLQGDPGQPNLSQPQDYEKWLQRVGDALDVIKVHDPQICEHLEKLAEMAKTNPVKFKSLLSMINML